MVEFPINRSDTYQNDELEKFLRKMFENIQNRDDLFLRGVRGREANTEDFQAVKHSYSQLAQSAFEPDFCLLGTLYMIIKFVV